MKRFMKTMNVLYVADWAITAVLLAIVGLLVGIAIGALIYS